MAHCFAHREERSSQSARRDGPGASAVGCDGRYILVWGLRVRYPYRRLKGVTTFGGVMPFLTAMMLSATAMPMRRFVS